MVVAVVGLVLAVRCKRHRLLVRGQGALHGDGAVGEFAARRVQLGDFGGGG